MATAVFLPGLAIAPIAHAANTLPSTKPLKVPELKYEKFGSPTARRSHARRPSPPVVAVDFWYQVGPLNERADRTGFTRLFEHMMFEGSEHVGEKAHIKYVQGAGATDVNGTTDFWPAGSQASLMRMGMLNCHSGVCELIFMP